MRMKQVIVLRKDLNMRKGKMVAQGCHACLGAASNASPDAVFAWRNGYNGVKICVGVDSAEELFKVHEEAKKLGLPTYLVLDMGLTEFKEPTYTAVGIGPATVEAVDSITGKLKLL